MGESLHKPSAAEADYTEKRKKTRREFVDRLRVCDAETGAPLGRLANLHSSGMLLLTDYPVRSGAMLRVHVQLPESRDGRAFVDLDMQCRWCHRSVDRARFEAGFRFVNTTFRQKHLLETFLAEAFPADDALSPLESREFR